MHFDFLQRKHEIGVLFTPIKIRPGHNYNLSNFIPLIEIQLYLVNYSTFFCANGLGSCSNCCISSADGCSITVSIVSLSSASLADASSIFFFSAKTFS